MSGEERRRPTGAELAMSREAGVREIAARIAAGAWQTNGHVSYAEERGIAPATAANWAGEALRQLRAIRESVGYTPDEQRALLVARLDRHEAAAGAGTREAIAAVLGIAKLEGVERGVQQVANELTAEHLRQILIDLSEEFAREPEVYARIVNRLSSARLAARGSGPPGLRVTVEGA